MSTPKIEAVTPKNCVLGEGPHWDDIGNVLYYVDIFGKEIFKYDPEKERQTSVKIEDEIVSFVTPVKESKDKFVIGTGRNISLLTWDGESSTPGALEVLATVEEEGHKLNDGKADASGRIWTGSYGPDPLKGAKGSVFSLSRGKKVTKHFSGVYASNGLTWTKDQKTFFYIDTFCYKVDALDFDIQPGSVANRRTVFDLKANGISGMPDGMTIDTNDKLWIAVFNGSQVIQVDPTAGKLLRSISLPCSTITSVAFGGKLLNELYVTTGTWELSDEDKIKYPDAGRVLRVTGLDAAGYPMHRFVL